MNDYKFDTVADLQAVVDQFCNCPKGSRLTVAKRVINRLKELGSFVRVFNDNPILIHKCDRFIIHDRSEVDNPFRKYVDMLRNDKYNYNKAVFEDIHAELNKCKGMTDIMCRSRQLNHDADVLFRQHYEDSIDHIYILVQACSRLFNFFMNGSDVNVCEEALDEIECIINGMYLSDYHVKRHLLYISMVQDWSLYKSLDTIGIADRVDRIMEMVKKDERDIFDFMRYNNKVDQVEFYMKMQKRCHEQTFVNSDFYTRGLETETKKVNANNVKDIYEFFKNQPNLKLPISRDIFRLKSNGFIDIDEVNLKGCRRLTCYRDGNIDHLILKSTLEDNVFFFIYRTRKGELKKFRVDIKPTREKMSADTMDRMLESMLINPDKMNRI